jgi:hypothetical protein
MKMRGNIFPNFQHLNYFRTCYKEKNQQIDARVKTEKELDRTTAEPIGTQAWMTVSKKQGDRGFEGLEIWACNCQTCPILVGTVA